MQYSTEHKLEWSSSKHRILQPEILLCNLSVLMKVCGLGKNKGQQVYGNINKSEIWINSGVNSTF